MDPKKKLTNRFKHFIAAKSNRYAILVSSHGFFLLKICSLFFTGCVMYFFIVVGGGGGGDLLTQ